MSKCRESYVSDDGYHIRCSLIAGYEGNHEAQATEVAPDLENAMPQPCADPTHAQYRALSSSNTERKS